MMVKKIEAFQAEDGKVFTDKAQARTYENLQIFKQKITNLVETQMASYDKEYIVSFIVDNRSTIKMFFDELVEWHE